MRSERGRQVIGGHQAVRTRVIADISVYTAGFQINASAQYNSLRKIRGSGDRADADNPAVVLIHIAHRIIHIIIF